MINFTFFTFIFLLFLTSFSKAEEVTKIDAKDAKNLENTFVIDEKYLEKSEKNAKQFSKSKINLLKFSNFSIDEKGNKIKGDLQLDERSVSRKEVQDSFDGERLFLQSFAYGGENNWSVVMNNVVLNSKSKEKSINDIVKIVSIDGDRVNFKFLGSVDDLIEAMKSRDVHKNDRYIKIIKKSDKTDFYFSLAVNQYFDMSECIIYSGNMKYSGYEIKNDDKKDKKNSN